MKRRTSFFLALLLVIMQFAGIRAFASDDVWSINYIGDYKTDRETYYAEISTSHALNGNRSLYVKYPNAAYTGTYLLAENTLAEPVSAGEYTFSVCYRGCPERLFRLLWVQRKFCFQLWEQRST